ncbi:hypothetical protein Gotri_016039 [Gossypium trilobum]|uniref:DUF4283 domain-containing protein n=1 Tax=Gossypium trilobum TaxID=34281 RepID=A0A7J9E2V1_9ROSI|nr:hypothetical protein [Gossypium trilobum]
MKTSSYQIRHQRSLGNRCCLEKGLISKIMFKDMETTVVLKLLGRNIGYAALFSHISSLWRPTKSFHLMDIEIGYFLAKLHIRLLGLLCFMYKRRILEAVGGLVGKMFKLDLSTDSKTRGYFARMVIFVDLDKPLVSQVMVNGELQRVEYEALPTIYFLCGKYSHLKELCPSQVNS